MNTDKLISANIFKIENSEEINDLESFLEKENFYKLIFKPDEMISTGAKKIRFENKSFEEVSFSFTKIEKVKFINCSFNKCLFLKTKFIDCTFSNCTFIGSNTLGSEWEGETSIDPSAFSKNFDFKEDVTIAVKHFVQLMKLYKDNHQVDREKHATYLYLKSTRNLQYYHYKIKKDITKKTFLLKNMSSWFFDKLSGYGVYKGRLIKILSIYLFLIAFFNYFLQYKLFNFCIKENKLCFEDVPSFFDLASNVFVINGGKIYYDFLDVLYFSFITITTIGYGDISPSTTLGQIVIMIESMLGILLIALSLNMFTNGK